MSEAAALPRPLVRAPSDNPYRSSCIDELPYRAPSLDWPSLVEKVMSAAPRGIILGPKGFGKTTFCLELVAQLQRRFFPACYLRVRDVRHDLDEALRAGAEKKLVVLDGGELLGWAAWLKLSRRRFPAGILVTRHTPNSWPVFWQCSTTPALLETLMGELSGCAPPAGRADSLWHKYDGNVREALRECYDQWFFER
jgi:hypothetical protein